ncbi:phosphoribosylanthranilate isomerase [Qipengyuania atrilutea]|uniref:N-(5'-phosphoribosyl)anthranilate isomerase n=1 Tax=Qipengyuania atrilutea TaxID=2744473 RepID=A0A850GZV8_9SPHN|nr:phosphoribosylanthranilate isomerase [Actirhodobacter atriluteus]NVD44016.1 phosphoribosylanthranilate isomerase [Actirhodobacter atriluteus]
MTTLVKICGLSTAETVDAAVDAGATHIGLVHFPPSPRHLELDEAAKLRARVPASVKVVLLTANAEPAMIGAAIDRIKPDIVQFHGKETPEWVSLVRHQAKLEVWKAVGLREKATLERARKWDGKVDRLLFDAPAKALPGGNGEAFDWNLLAEHEHSIPWALAGGLTPDNVAKAIRETGAPLVDTSSGVESAPGVKDMDLIRAFCQAALA